MGWGGELQAFLGSDLNSCPAYGYGFAQCYGANILAHSAIAMFAAVMIFLMRGSWMWFIAPLFFLTSKEIFFDAPMAWPEALVMFDSAIDFATYTLSFAFVWWALMREDNQ